MRITIAKKIAFPLLIILILFIGMIGINYQGFKKVTASLDNMELETVKRGISGNLRFHITQLLMPANDFIITGHQHYESAFDSLNNIVNNNFYEFSKLLLTTTEKQLLIKIKSNLDSIRSYSKQIFSIPEPRQSQRAIQLMETMDYRFGEEVTRITSQIFDEISRRNIEYVEQGERVKESVTTLLFGAAFFSIFITIIITFLTIHRISKPIIAVAKAADSLANGDYSHRVVVRTNDEVALLAKSFNVMAESIEHFQKEHQEFKTILYSIGDGVITTNNAGVVKLMNLVAERLTGLSESDAKGRRLEDIIQIVNEVTQKKVENPVERVLSDGIVVGLANHTFLLISKDGKEIPVAVSGAPIRNGQGDIEGVVLVFRDKTEEHKVEKLIRQSEARLKRAEFVSKAGNWELHLDFKIIIASEGAAKLYGVHGSQFDYSAIKEIPLPGYRQLLDNALRNLIENGEPYDLEFKIKNAETGEIIDIHSVAEYDKENKIIFGVIQDITENKKAEAAIRESEERFRSVTQTANDAIVTADSKGIILGWNKGAEKIFGFSDAEIIGKSLELIIPTEYRNKHHTGIEQRGAESEHPLVGKTMELRGLHKSGNVFPVELSLSDWKTSDKTFYAGIIRDISKRKKAEAEQEKQREILERLNALSGLLAENRSLEQSLDKGLQIILSTSFLRLKQMGAVFLVSSKNTELALKCHFNLVPTLQSMCALVPFGHCLCGRAALTGDIQYAGCIDERHDNHYTGIKPHGHYNIPIISNKELLGVIVVYLSEEHPYNSLEVSFLQSTADVFSAIIKRKQAETEIKLKHEQLEKTNSEKDKFFSIIAHDLRSPFSGFLNLTEMMADGSEDFSKTELTKFSKSLHESASTVYKLLENLLEWAQMQKGTISFTPGEQLLSKMVSFSINTINQRALQKGITIIDEVSKTQKVYADEKMINTVLRNFLSNAVKFTMQGGEIIVRTKKLDDEMVEISVSDTGVGMAEKDVNKLFKMEEKVSSRGTEGEPSTGLGLLLCKEFIEKNGGKVQVESEKGKGSIFYFTVPESNDKNN